LFLRYKKCYNCIRRYSNKLGACRTSIKEGRRYYEQERFFNFLSNYDNLPFDYIVI